MYYINSKWELRNQILIYYIHYSEKIVIYKLVIYKTVNDVKISPKNLLKYCI